MMTLRSDLGSFSWNEGQFGLLRNLIHEQPGIYFQDSQAELLASKLAPLLAERRIDSFLDYYYLLKYDSQSKAEWGQVASALSVTETFFWREVDQIKAAAEWLVPAIQAERPGAAVRIWHAACATGEEPYSMAMALAENQCFERGRIEIIATDFDGQALDRARAGQYRERSFRAFPEDLRRKYFSSLNERHALISEDIRDRVQFARLNLVDESAMQAYQNFDIIFCRNVFIYFSKTAIEKVITRFHSALREPGYLCVASSESLLRITKLFQLDEIQNAFVYKKVAL